MKKAMPALAAALLVLAGCGSPAAVGTGEQASAVSRPVEVPSVVCIALADALPLAVNFRPKAVDARTGEILNPASLLPERWTVSSQSPQAEAVAPIGSELALNLTLAAALQYREQNEQPGDLYRQVAEQNAEYNRQYRQNMEDALKTLEESRAETRRQMTDLCIEHGVCGGYPAPEDLGYPVLCGDGSLSQAGGRQGACSWHGGVDD